MAGAPASIRRSNDGEVIVADWHIAAQSQCGSMLAGADFASSSQHVRDGQCIAKLEAEFEALQRQVLALGEEPTADFAPWVLLGVKIAARRERAV
jgi:hypothetical protein